METILAANCGSSSIKFKLFSSPRLDVLISGQASSVATKGQKPTIKLKTHVKDHEETHNEEENENMAYEDVFERIINLMEEALSQHFQNAKIEDVVVAVAHRVVHGGNETEPMDIYSDHTEGLDKLDKLSEFAPLHNHRAVQVVKFCLKHLPKAHQILCFDTLFHSSLPKHIYTYPIRPSSEPTAIPLRKYGAHGLSYAYILDSMAKHLHKPVGELNLVVAHLGSGASCCLIKAGKSYDTSMGLTPLEGLPGGTRAGSVDAALIFHHTPSASEIVDFNGFAISKGEMTLNKDGGIQAIAGTSNFGQIVAGMNSNADYRLAYEVFLDRLLNFLGAYVVKLLGSGSNMQIDGIVFSGGIGEKSMDLRRDVAQCLGWLGCTIDEDRNRAGVTDAQKDGIAEVTNGESKVKMFVCQTDEEIQTASMALDSMKRYEFQS